MGPLSQFPHLDALPLHEDHEYEYKSGMTSDSELGQKIGRAASAFWNAGSGLLVLGVGNDGKVDCGISDQVGRESRRAWIDKQLTRVTPTGPYAIGQTTFGHSANDRSVYMIRFATSGAAPHMAPDNRYYIRAGAHTEPAPHFIVEALRARRAMVGPVLRPIARVNPSSYYMVQLGLVALTPSPALDVRVLLTPSPPMLGKGDSCELHVAVIQPDAPYFVNLDLLQSQKEERAPPLTVRVDYTDLVGNSYSDTTIIDVDRQIAGSNTSRDSNLVEIDRRLRSIDDSLKSIAKAVQSFDGSLRNIRFSR